MLTLNRAERFWDLIQPKLKPTNICPEGVVLETYQPNANARQERLVLEVNQPQLNSKTNPYPEVRVLSDPNSSHDGSQNMPFNQTTMLL